VCVCVSVSVSVCAPQVLPRGASSEVFTTCVLAGAAALVLTWLPASLWVCRSQGDSKNADEDRPRSPLWAVRVRPRTPPPVARHHASCKNSCGRFTHVHTHVHTRAFASCMQARVEATLTCTLVRIACVLHPLDCITLLLKGASMDVYCSACGGHHDNCTARHDSGARAMASGLVGQLCVFSRPALVGAAILGDVPRRGNTRYSHCECGSRKGSATGCQ
jgi:hypothetical protein